MAITRASERDIANLAREHTMLSLMRSQVCMTEAAETASSEYARDLYCDSMEAYSRAVQVREQTASESECIADAAELLKEIHKLEMLALGYRHARARLLAQLERSARD